MVKKINANHYSLATRFCRETCGFYLKKITDNETLRMLIVPSMSFNSSDALYVWMQTKNIIVKYGTVYEFKIK